MTKHTLIIFSSLLLFSGCTFLSPVKVYEKETLAQQKMLITPLSEDASFEGHVFGIREGTVGAESSFQGGCGCK